MVNRLLPALLAALVLSACAAGPVGPAPVSAGPGAHRASPLGPRLDPAIALQRAGAADAITTAEARMLFGRPDVDRRDGVGALMVWTLPSCALTLAFANDRLRSVEPGPRRTGSPAPSLQTCVAEARNRTPTS